MSQRSKAERVACVVVCTGWLVAAAGAQAGKPKGSSEPPSQVSTNQASNNHAAPNRASTQTSGTSINPIQSAFLNGRQVTLQLAKPGPGKKRRQVGPWYFGERIEGSRPRDRRLNLYVITPAAQTPAEGHEILNSTNVLSEVPADEQPLEWDVYWAVVLDPGLEYDFRSEGELLMATQREFGPGERFQLEDMPGAGFLKRILKINSMENLERYRRPSGNLPQVLIVPAGFAVRASVKMPEEELAGPPEVPGESRNTDPKVEEQGSETPQVEGGENPKAAE